MTIIYRLKDEERDHHIVVDNIRDAFITLNTLDTLDAFGSLKEPLTTVCVQLSHNEVMMLSNKLYKEVQQHDRT